MFCQAFFQKSRKSARCSVFRVAARYRRDRPRVGLPAKPSREQVHPNFEAERPRKDGPTNRIRPNQKMSENLTKSKTELREGEDSSSSACSLSTFLKRYRIMPDSFSGYEVQVWRIWFPFWVQMHWTNTHSTEEDALRYAKSYASPTLL